MAYGFRLLVLIWIVALSIFTESNLRSEESTNNLQRDRLVAWCIVPFDAQQRGPIERAAMLKQLGITKCAYDWRDEHVDSFEAEFQEYQKQGIELFAFWSSHPEAFRLFKKYDLHPQIWRTVPSPTGKTQEERVQASIDLLLPHIEQAETHGCAFGLYNHGGWGGEPENMISICKRLRETGHPDVGIVYNFHHGHDQINNWKSVFAKLKPYLLCLNVNGMNADARPKILPLGKGKFESEMLKVVLASDYRGPIGILDHLNHVDSKEALQANLTGFGQLGIEIVDQPASQEGAEVVDVELVRRIAADVTKSNGSANGAKVFAGAKTACISCHQIGGKGGKVGPDLSKLAIERPVEKIIESILWPQLEVKPEYLVKQIMTIDGKVISGFQHQRTDDTLVLRDVASGEFVKVLIDDIEVENDGTTPMPAALVSGLPYRDQVDLVRFLLDLRGDQQPLPEEITYILEHSQSHSPTKFTYDREPLEPGNWPNASKQVNRGRVYDYYTKQADYFRQQFHKPMLLSPFPSLDGPDTGHWGNQSEGVWRNLRWNEMDLGSVQSGVLRFSKQVIPRAICVQLSEGAESYAVCFNPDSLEYEVFWKGEFVAFSGKRHGFMDGLSIAGEVVSTDLEKRPSGKSQYLGYYRNGTQVAFSYLIGDEEYLDVPTVRDGQFVRVITKAAEHPLRGIRSESTAQWPQILETKITRGNQVPFAVDQIASPTENPWNSLMYFGGIAFRSDGTALLCTMQGEVWHVSGLDGETASWKRFAAGLHQALGIVVDDQDRVFVLCRDQLVRLVDMNQDNEADYYQCWNNQFTTSPAGHDFICGLDQDQYGNFYTASGNEGVLRISADGKSYSVVATGFRNPDGVSVTSHGTVTVPCSEGTWTPASMVCEMPQNPSGDIPPYFGYGGPKDGKPPALPLAYLPRGLDNSSGGQVPVKSSNWGPLEGKLMHLSFGMGTSYLLLRDEYQAGAQGAIVPFASDFNSGVHRGEFRKQDGQLYVAGMAGWGTYTSDDGCFARVRYTGQEYQVPTGFRVHENGVLVKFAQEIDKAMAEDISQHFAQCWNYRYSGAYGSPEYSPSHPGALGHDPLEITSVHVQPDGKSLFLKIPKVQPVNQLHLRIRTNPRGQYASYNPVGDGHDLFITVHHLDDPFTRIPGYVPQKKTIAVHPMLADIRLSQKRKPNPWAKKVNDSTSVTLKTGKNLTFAKNQIVVKAGQKIKFKLQNPDVVPHNWVLTKPGTLQDVGLLANRLIASPDAFAEHYIPKTDDVLIHTDVVGPGQSQTIYFQAPDKPGRYPYLCTFPGHWMVMNGVMVVEE